jgi:DNA polymerase
MDLKAGFGASPESLKELVRPLLVGPFTVADYASIEARVLAWLAGEGWALKAFKAGRDIYQETAQRMGGLSRAQGKIAVLALGYNGSVNSLKVMAGAGIFRDPKTGKVVAFGAIGEAHEAGAVEFTEEEYLSMVRTWRDANPSIVSMWNQLGEAFRVGGAAGRIKVEVHGDSRALRLPSGRAIWYHGCKWTFVESAYGPRREASFRDPKYPVRARTYGGRLTENVTQAVARDILAEALVRLEQRGYETVAHVHDEIIVAGAPPVDEVVKVMCELPDWATGLPVDAEGFITERYRKG